MKLYGFYNMAGSIPGFAFPVFTNGSSSYWFQDGADTTIRRFLSVSKAEIEQGEFFPVHMAKDLSGLQGLHFAVQDSTVLAVQTDDATVVYGRWDDILPLLFRQKIALELKGNTLQNHSFAIDASQLWMRFYRLKCAQDSRILDKGLHKTHLGQEALVTDILRAIGCPAHLKGYHYLQDAVLMVVEAPDLIHSVTTLLYPKIAEKHGTLPTRVERSIRNAIEKTWEQNSNETLARYFGRTLHGQGGRPTNSEAISVLADRVVLDQRRGA